MEHETIDSTDDGLVVLYLDGAEVGWKTRGALILDPSLTPLEVRWVEAKAHVAFRVFGHLDPSHLSDAELDYWARYLLIPTEDLKATDDDRYIADTHFVPAHQVTKARRERRLRLELEAATRLWLRRRPS